MNVWFQEYCVELYKLLQQLFQQHVLFSPLQSPVRLNKNVSLINAAIFSLKKSGVTLPMIPGMKPLHIYKIGTRLNSFKLLLPLKTPGENSVHHKRFLYLKELREYNNKYLPHFMPMVSVLPIV